MAAGLVMLPAVVFHSSVGSLAAQVIIFMILQIIRGERIRMLPNIIMIVSVTALNLLQAHGRVLFTLWPLPITQGALEIGLRKALTLIALIYLSRFMVSGKPRFPGRIGMLLSMQFSYYNQFLQHRLSLKPGQIVSSLDALLVRMETDSPDAVEAAAGPWKLTAVISAAAAAAVWGAWLYFKETAGCCG